MNTLHLQEGQVFKSYKALCEEIGETPKKTKEKKERHYEVFRQYFDFEHVTTQKIKITKVHKKGDFKNTYTTRSKYVNEISILILNELNKNNGELFVTMKQLMDICGMITKVYGQDSVKQDIVKAISDNPQKESICINSIFYQMNNKISDMIYRCLDRLKKQEIIEYDKKTYVISENGKEIATSSMENMIEELEKLVLKEYSCNSLQHVIIKGKYKSFFDEVRRLLKEKHNIYNYYKVVKIKITCVSNNVPQYAQQEVTQAKARLQEITYTTVLDLLTKRKENHDMKSKEIKHSNMHDPEFTENYMDFARILTVKFIKSPDQPTISISKLRNK